MIWRLLSALTTAVVLSAYASGPYEYETPFVERLQLSDVIAGKLPDGLSTHDVVFPLIVYLHLNGQFTYRHAALFLSEHTQSEPTDDFEARFWHLVRIQGRGTPALFGTHELVSRFASRGRDRSRTVSQYVRNCQPDAFKTAYETLLARRRHHGSGSVELSRWIDAQLKVFARCSGETPFDPPEEPASDWLPLEQHDRRYQIAAAYFYDGQYLEAASRFGEIAQNPDSPWRDLGRYLVPRSLTREAIVNENDRDRHLLAALAAYRELASDPAYLAAFPSVTGQIRYIRTTMAPVLVRREVEQRILDDPESLTAEDIHDYTYLLQKARPSGDSEDAPDYESWLWYATHYPLAADGAVEHWRTKQTLPWLYVALAHAGPELGETTLAR